MQRSSGGGLERRGGGTIARAAIGTIVGIVAVIVAFHVLAFLAGAIFFALKVAIAVVVIGAVVALLRRVF
jgi:hypothetical protein